MRGRSDDDTRRQAQELAQTYQNCCHVAGITYTVEEFADDHDQDRAPL